MFYFLIFVVFIILLFDFALNCNKEMKMIKKIPGATELILFGNFLDFVIHTEKYWIRRATPVEMFIKLRNYAKKYNGIYKIWACGIKTVHIYNPNDIEEILSTVKNNEKSLTYEFLKPWLGEGLLLSCGQKWHHRRKILTGAFHFTILRQFSVVLEENTHRLVQNLKKTRGKATDICPLVEDFTLNSICETAMGTKLHDNLEDTEASSYRYAIHNFGVLLVERIIKGYVLDFMLYILPIGRQINETVDTLQSFSGKVIKTRKLQTEENKDDISNENKFRRNKNEAMLDLLISAEKEGIIDSVGIQEEVDTFMFEGHDTSSAGLIYCLMLLANHKEIQDKIYEELREVFGESSRQASIDDLSKLRYLECCIKESLRLYPPVPVIGRKLSEPTTLSNYSIPAGTHVHIHIYDLHRSENLFKNASVFDPDRFLPENSIGRHPYAYIPFSAGPRNCIGRKLAMLEMKSCVAGVLREFELKAVTTPDQIKFSVDMILRSYQPIMIQFIKRI